MKITKYEILFLLAVFLFGFCLMLLVFKFINFSYQINETIHTKRWQIESIDTMKYSRDAARQGLNNPVYTAQVKQQVAAIAKTGATYVAIDTPYDAEFLPVLKVWVQ